MNDRDMAEGNTILRGVVGSTVHGLSVSDQDDRDEMGVCVEPFEHFFRLRNSFEQWTYRTQPEGKRSGPGDLDLVIYSLSKWARLALSGNPTIITLLFAPESSLTVMDPMGADLRKLSPEFIGDNLFGPYLGYMQQQRKRMENKHKMPNRPELVEAHGYDTKYAGHIIRLGYQGIEIATTRRLSLPMKQEHRERILAIRTGKVPESEVLEESLELESELKRLQDKSDLGPPNRQLVESFVIDCYMTRHGNKGR